MGIEITDSQKEVLHQVTIVKTKEGIYKTYVPLIGELEKTDFHLLLHFLAGYFNEKIIIKEDK